MPDDAAPTSAPPPTQPPPTASLTPPPLAAPPDHPIRSVLVVGAGLAGARTVAALRAHGFDGRITLLGREPHLPYDRPPLSKHLLDRPEPAWLTDELGVDVGALADAVHLGTSVDGLTVQRRDVVARAGDRSWEADAAVLATGSRAVRPAAWRTAVTLHTADDAARLRARLGTARRLVVVGAGWIGAEVAGVAATAGLDVTVVEATSSPLGAALGARVGDLTADWYAAAGVRLLTGSEVTAVDDDGVTLLDGRHLPAGVVLAAIGARPDTDWLADTLPRDPDGSLRVDSGHAVLGSPAHVRAVGDIARRWSPRHGWVGGGHWDGALRGPASAVAGLLGGEVTDPAPYVFSTQLGHDLTLYGQPGIGDELVLRGDPTGAGGWGALWFASGVGTPDTPAPGERADGRRRVLTAVLAVDRPRDVAAARRMFTGPALPLLDPAVAADGARPLRDAVLG